MKKFLALLLALAMIFALAACGGGTEEAKTENTENTETNEGSTETSTGNELAGTYDIVVWCPEKEVELRKAQIQAFNETNEDGIIFNATVENVGEGDAATQMITDVEAGADLYNFASDQFARLVQANAVSKLGTKAAGIVTESNDVGAVNAVTIGGEMYAYPLTADNCYFMYYDKSVIPEEAVGDLDAILAACEENNKYFAFDVGNAWYMAAFFFGAGCVSEWSTDAEGHWNVNDDFNSDKGIIAMKGLNKLESSPMFLSKSGASEFDGGAAVVVSGTWDAAAVQQILGDNMGVAPLPKFTVDGTSYDLTPFMGYKFIGVKPQTDPVRNAALHKLAQYLISEDAQVERHDVLGWGPANVNAQQAESVKSDPVIAAVVAQTEHCVNQGQVNDGWWNLAAALAATAKETDDEETYKAALTTYDEGLEKLKNLREGLLFVGAWNGWNNADDADTFVFTDNGDGTYTLTLDVPESDYMGGRIVNIGTWENDKGFAQVTVGADLIKDLGADNPDNNIVFAEAGNYTVTWNGSEITITKN